MRARSIPEIKDKRKQVNERKLKKLLEKYADPSDHTKLRQQTLQKWGHRGKQTGTDADDEIPVSLGLWDDETDELGLGQEIAEGNEWEEAEADEWGCKKKGRPRPTSTNILPAGFEYDDSDDDDYKQNIYDM